MIRWLFKYAMVVFLFNTVLLSIEHTFDLGYKIFLLLMAVYSICLLINPKQIQKVIFHKSFYFLLALNFINLLYFIVFHSINDVKAIEYLLARGIQFSIISFSIYYNYDYYKDKFLNHLVYLIIFIVFIGLFLNFDIFSNRYSGIIWNPNMLASFVLIAFSILFLEDRDRSKYDYILLVILILVALATGSRGVLVGFFLAFLFKYGFSVRNMLYGFLALGVYFLSINFQLETSINRLASQDLLNDRTLQYQYAYETILQKPFFGFGLDKYAYISSEIIPHHLTTHIISAHNGYLAILTQYGIVFGCLIIIIVLKKCYQVTNYFRKSIGAERIYLFILIYALFASLYETLITGINEFHTILFWFSLAFLSFTRFKELWKSR